MVDARAIHPPFGGEIAAQVTVLTPIGTVIVTGRLVSAISAFSRLTRSSSERIGTTASTATGSVSANVRSPSTVGTSSSSPAG